jgi:hypothetical protein
MTNAQATASLKAGFAEYLSLYGVEQFLTRENTALSMAQQYDEVDELCGLTIEEAAEIMQAQIDAAIEAQEEFNSFDEILIEAARRTVYAKMETIKKASNIQPTAQAFTDTFVRFDNNGVARSVDYSLLLASGWDIKSQRAIDGFDAYEDVFVHLRTEQILYIITTAGPNGSEVTVFNRYPTSLK